MVDEIKLETLTHRQLGSSTLHLQALQMIGIESAGPLHVPIIVRCMSSLYGLLFF
jgi:hypothetical protein